MNKDILPDCRARDPKGATPGPGGSWIPISCASCKRDGGLVPEQNMTFVFWLCAPCAETYGKIAGLMFMPDEVFWEQVKQEQLEAYGRLLTNEELSAIVEADGSPLATLVKHGPQGGR